MEDCEANKAVIRRLVEGVQRDGDFELFEELFAEDYVESGTSCRLQTMPVWGC